MMFPFSDEELYYAVKNALPQVSTYVDSHGGGIALLGVNDAVVYIQLGGACSGCSMSLMTTNMVVRRELRKLIHPELFVINVDGTAENELPSEYFAPEEESNEESKEDKRSFMTKIKTMFAKAEKNV
jgi:Fe-S cluster biogenesis protein NfuA